MKKIILKTAKKESNKKHSGGVFYAVLFIAIILVGTTSYVMHVKNTTVSELSRNTQQFAAASPQIQPIKLEIPPNIVPSEEETTVSEEYWESDDVIPLAEDSEPEVTEQAMAEATPITAMLAPVEGKVIKPHSDTELSYSKTMEDWRLHKGIDIATPIGTEVRASAKGVVLESYTDTATGVTVIIDHGNGVMSRYSNLASTNKVQIGQSVESGMIIGVVGDTAEFEIADEPHLHFEVIKDGRCVDPQSYFN